MDGSLPEPCASGAALIGILVDGSLTEIPRERIHIPGRGDNDDPDD